MNEIMIFNNPEFGEIRTIEEDGKVLFCAKDVAVALGYKDPTNAIKQHCRGVVKRHLTDSLGRDQITNFIPEGDIYRLAAKSELPGADAFESWIFDEVLPSIRRTGEYKTPRKAMTDYQQMMANTRERNARIQSARILTQLARQYHGTTYEQVLNAHATREPTGEYLLPLPKLEAKTYSAGEIGEMLGISANKVGTLTNRNNLKTEQYGQWFKEKSRSSNIEVPNFRYYETVIPALQELLQKAKCRKGMGG